MRKPLPLILPGEILLEEYLKPAGISQNGLARAIAVPPGRVSDIVHGRRGITRDTAAWLAVFFGTKPDLWINLQARYDSKLAERDLMPRMARRIRRYHAAAA